MTELRKQMIELVWRGNDPFQGFPKNIYQVDTQGWGFQHPYLSEAIAGSSLLVVEVGVWKGASTIAMASKMRDLDIDGAIICVDTWLGAADHWTQNEWFEHLGWDHGWPNLHRKFMANIIDAGLQDYVVPLPVDSINAAEVLKHYSVQADVIHIDAGHEYRSVISDLHAWWPILKEGGLYIGDDYYDNGIDWPGVQQAHDEFFKELNLLPFEHGSGKCRLRKPG
ncbi:hypothetical protein Sphch_2694 [Sphingobium chlorophenolicum L-1]|uniref:Methyltransferase n=1 Tax=Sphingobium chlorophenolicum L-1 TaxID=690566 RepID=F6F0L5_SPHCR|nr:class I SAM-dependent methyltransferase [Sphingobium chlorophenolicum]AEG50337.1 hypothetical protein Sphch_2694 [Sphingobium chlorophenolicum L-1]